MLNILSIQYRKKDDLFLLTKKSFLRTFAFYF